MARQLISIVEIADIICEDVGDVTKRHRRSILRHLSTCYRTLKTFVSNETDVVTECFPIGSVINMPSNFIRETKVGLKYGDRVVFLSENYDNTGSSVLSVNQSGALTYIEDNLFSDQPKCCDTTPFYNYRGELVLHGYGNGIKCEGMYVVDRKNGRIIIGSELPKGCEVVVEYISDGVANGIDLVPIEFYDALYNYGQMKYFFQKGDPRFRVNEQNYDTAYYQLEMMYKFLPIDYIVKLFNKEMHTVDDRL